MLCHEGQTAYAMKAMFAGKNLVPRMTGRSKYVVNFLNLGEAFARGLDRKDVIAVSRFSE